jgi:predicted ABC-type transport system involved in lysophospholipase L1 biosynthesis ATPase subunit
MSDDILVARGLSKTYTLGRQRLEVLRGINLQVRRGEALVIVGASGAGKTTLLHLLGGLDSPAGGEVSLDGVSVFRLSGAARARMRNERVGFVFQSYNLLPELDALENVCLPALLARGRADAVQARGTELLRAVGLGERLEHRPAELSGGRAGDDESAGAAAGGRADGQSRLENGRGDPGIAVAVAGGNGHHARDGDARHAHCAARRPGDGDCGRADFGVNSRKA